MGLIRAHEKFRSWPNCELNMQEIRQQIGSAFRSPPEHVVSRVVTSEIDPEENFSKIPADALNRNLKTTFYTEICGTRNPRRGELMWVK